MKFIIITIITILLTSCSFNEFEFEKLKSENEKLRSKIDSIEFEKDKLIQRVVIFPNDNKITLGEEYEAVVFQTLEQRNVPTQLTLYDITPNPKIKDTLRFESENDIPEISFTPKDTGHYLLRGKFQQTVLGGEYDLLFEAEFDVEEK